MPKSQPKQQNACQHKYCPHLHFQRCKKNRESYIAYTHWPIKEIELTCNQHPKTLDELRTTNIATLAVQRYSLNPVLPDQEEANFSKNYYLQNCPQNYQLRNTMLKDLQVEIQTNNAYVLAVGARTQYQIFAKQREEYLKSARRRAGVAFQQFHQNKTTQKERLQAEQKRWIIQYYRKVQELIGHIFPTNDSQNEDPNLKDKLFLKEQQGNNPKKLATVTVKDPQAALGILQSLRAVLLARKLELEQVRKDQQNNKSATASQIDTSNAQNTSEQNASAASFISAANNETNQTNAEQHNAEKYCNFVQLKKKWGKASVEEVRKILRIMLCRDSVNKAEGFHMRDRRKAQQKDHFLKREMQKMMNGGKKIEKMTKNGKTAKNKKSELIKSKDQQKIEQKIILSAQKLSKQDQTVKQSLLKGGIFDSVGNIYQRNRNYSHLFKKRAEQSLCQLSMRQSLDAKVRPENARTSLR